MADHHHLYHDFFFSSIVNTDFVSYIHNLQQLARLLRDKIDYDYDMFSGQPKEINRSSSAPPAQVVNAMGRYPDPNELDPMSPTDPRLDPDYPAYYYAHAKFDPRLPPPIVTPSQSWQLWAGNGLNPLGSKGNGATNGNTVVSGNAGKGKVLEKFRGLGKEHIVLLVF